MDALKWRRADLGDVPERGDVISMVIFEMDGGLRVWPAMRCEVVMEMPKVAIHGPGIEGSLIDFEIPKRPAGVLGKVIMWRKRE